MLGPSKASYGSSSAMRPITNRSTRPICSAMSCAGEVDAGTALMTIWVSKKTPSRTARPASVWPTVKTDSSYSNAKLSWSSRHCEPDRAGGESDVGVAAGTGVPPGAAVGWAVGAPLAVGVAPGEGAGATLEGGWLVVGEVATGLVPAPGGGLASETGGPEHGSPGWHCGTGGGGVFRSTMMPATSPKPSSAPMNTATIATGDIRALAGGGGGAVPNPPGGGPE